MHLDDVTFIDLEADRRGQPLVLGWVRGSAAGRISLRGKRTRPRELAALGGVIAGHNVREFDLPLLAQARLEPASELVIDSLPLSLLADPLRTTHALDKSERPPGAVPDPVQDARASRERVAESLETIAEMAPEVLAWHVALFDRGGERGLSGLLGNARPGAGRSLVELTEALPEALLARFCRVRLRALLETLSRERPREALSLSLAVRFVEVTQPLDERHRGRLGLPSSPALAMLPRFGELLTRLMGPLCPDLDCGHRFECDVHRPHAEDILQETFELDSFRPNQKQIVEAVLADRTPLVVLPTGGGKSLCYQVPAVHGAQRLRGLTVVVSPLQALSALTLVSRRCGGACAICATPARRWSPGAIGS